MVEEDGKRGKKKRAEGGKREREKKEAKKVEMKVRGGVGGVEKDKGGRQEEMVEEKEREKKEGIKRARVGGGE